MHPHPHPHRRGLFFHHDRMYARKRLLLLCVLCGWHHCKLDLQSVIVHCEPKLERGEMSEEEATFLSYWKGTTLIRVKDKASHCHGEKRNVKRYEKEVAITKVPADGYGGWGCGANCKDSKRKCRLPLLYLFHGVKKYQNTTSHSAISNS